MATGVYPRISAQERFEQKIEFDLNGGCWLWGAGCDRDGYGDFWLGQTVKAHRMSWRIYRGEIANDLWVLHRCDVPSCVNPAHLFLGTSLENISDMIRKKRHIHGDTHHHSKLREADIPEIRRRAEAREPLDRIAADYGVLKSAISAVRYRRVWKHV